MQKPKAKKMTVFTLSMMTVAAVCSLRGLPMMAKEGLSMIFLYPVCRRDVPAAGVPRCGGVGRRLQ